MPFPSVSSSELSDSSYKVTTMTTSLKTNLFNEELRAPQSARKSSAHVTRNSPDRHEPVKIGCDYYRRS